MRNFFKSINDFLKRLISGKDDVSSNRVLGIFVYSPALIVMIFTGVGIEYCLAVIGLITALLITNAVSKFQKKDKIG